VGKVTVLDSFDGGLEATMRITIDKAACTGHARCLMFAPALIEDDENGYGVVLADGHVTEATVAQARKAVQACPERAITLED
jgi:ferredoxin